MANTVCYCALGMMAQCVANDVNEQMACFFSAQSSNAKRCMHLNTSMNDHCWNTKAHDFSMVHGVVRIEDIVADESEIYDETLELELGEPRRNCRNCMSYTSCSKLIDLARAKPGGITEQDLWTHGSACGSYIGETKISISGGI